MATILPQTKLEQVYRALVESHLRYGNELWGSLSDTKLNHLQYIQDRPRALIENAHSRDGWVHRNSRTRMRTLSRDLTHQWGIIMADNDWQKATGSATRN